MKPIKLILLLLSGFLTINQSCKKASPEENLVKAGPDKTITTTIEGSKAYVLDVNNAGTVSIIKQATHYLVSRVEIDSTSGKLVYKYLPAIGFEGADEVMIRTAKTAQNNFLTNYNTVDTHMYTTYTSIAIKFTVIK